MDFKLRPTLRFFSWIKTLEMLEKYNEHPRTEINQSILPDIIDIKTSPYLKEVADLYRFTIYNDLLN
ncbi:hypothetical protein DET49_10491 [Salegentibacter sp. 24]|jgi:hypothetical protein|uniref:hypothetical protein n=1 Tax=Salegentibacter sp. 24 TaxID=2183986 RepID=UPI001061EABC|nr:hypothetical protein [Salegentibacter sp. 24]TDN93365.1 hypothetical protein DET49_10491 [Salegentibacter sp. 24]